MIGNLFFNVLWYLQRKRRKDLRFFSVLLVVLFFVPHLLGATAFENDPVEQNHATGIYVSGNAIIYGNSNISNAIVTRIEPVKKETVKFSDKSKFKTIRKEVVENKTDCVEIAKKKSTKILHFYRLPPASSHTDGSCLFSKNFCVTSSKQSDYFPPAKAVSITPKLLPAILAQSKKQKYYSSLSYLQFGKYRSSSLRGPPTLNFKF